jgi:hypothetical protein
LEIRRPFRGWGAKLDFFRSLLGPNCFAPGNPSSGGNRQNLTEFPTFQNPRRIILQD